MARHVWIPRLLGITDLRVCLGCNVGVCVISRRAAGLTLCRSLTHVFRRLTISVGLSMFPCGITKAVAETAGAAVLEDWLEIG